MQLVEEGDQGRIPELIPLRHGRMMQSPFTYYRGAALAMAVDLAGLPTTGIRVQACGDAHLGNFRCLATPERRMIFDIHDLDETLPAPWEWDLKRLAASFGIASRNNGLSDKRARAVGYALMNTFAVKMAAVFIIVTCSIGLRTAVFPRWMAFIGYALALVMLLTITGFAWIALVFPSWVLLLSVYILVSDFRQGKVAASAEI